MTSNTRTNAAGGQVVTLHLSRKGVDKNWREIDAMLAAGVTITIVRKKT